MAHQLLGFNLRPSARFSIRCGARDAQRMPRHAVSEPLAIAGRLTTSLHRSAVIVLALWGIIRQPIGKSFWKFG
jgi:hypothetical protein